MPVALRQGRPRRRRRRTISTARWTRSSIEAFIDALLDGAEDRVQGVGKGTPYFDGCLPIEVMAERGAETLRYGPMKPVGLTNPTHPAGKPYAVVQLRQDNALGTLWNMVGFQTKLKHGAQTRDLPDDPRAGERRVRAAGRPAPQHLHQLARAAGRRAAAEGAAAYALCRSGHGRRGLCRKRRRSGLLAGPFRRRRARWAARSRRRPTTTALGALVDPHHRRASDGQQAARAASSR